MRRVAGPLSAGAYTAVSTTRLAAAGLSMIAVCYGLARFAYGLFVPAFREEFGLGAAAAGTIASSSYAGYCLAIVAATFATVRWGPRPVATAAGLAAVAGTGLIAWAPNVALLAVGVVVGGSSTGLASPPLADAVSRWVHAQRADRVQSVVNAGTGLGVLVSGPVALLLSGNWRFAWAAYCGLAVVVTLWNASTIPPAWRHDGPAGTSAAQHGRTESARPPHALGRTESARPPQPQGRTGSARPRRWQPGMARLLLAAATMGAGSSAVWIFARDLFVTTGGMSEFASTVLWIVLGAAGMLGAFTGDLVARTGLGRAWVVAMLLLAAATTSLALAPGLLPPAVAGVALFGAVYIALTGILLIWGTRVHPGRPAFGVGAAFLSIALGQAIAGPLVGLLADLTTAPIAFCAAALVTALGALLRP